MALKKYGEAARTAIIIAREEQIAGNLFFFLFEKFKAPNAILFYYKTKFLAMFNARTSG